MPPIHPAIVHFPIAFVVLSVVCEFIGYFGRSAAARTVAWWSLVAALIGGVLTIAAGYSDMWRASLAEPTHAFVDQHMKIGWTIAVCLIVLTAWRWYLRRSAPAESAASSAAVGGGYLTFATVVFALVMFQGWYGGEMAYAHGAGVAATGQGMVPAPEAKQRLTRVHRALEHLPFLGDDDEHHEHGSEPAASRPPQ